MLISRIIAHFQSHYDSHISAAAGAAVSLPSTGLAWRLEDVIWAVITGLCVFAATQFVKKIFKIK